MPRLADFSNLSRDDLLTAVRDLVARRRITADEVRDAAGLATRIAGLEAEIARLRGGEKPRRRPGRPHGSGRPARVARPVPAAKVKRKITNTPQRIAAMKRQGEYLGVLSKLTGTNRTRVKTVAKKDGVPAALKLAGTILKR